MEVQFQKLLVSFSHARRGTQVPSQLNWSTIPAMVRDAARRFPDVEAVVDGDRRVSYAELSASVSDAARALLAFGLERGDRVAVWAPNSLEWIVAALGVTTAGGVLVPVNTRFRGAEARLRPRAQRCARPLHRARLPRHRLPGAPRGCGRRAPRARAHGRPQWRCRWRGDRLAGAARSRRCGVRRRRRRPRSRRSVPTTRATSCSPRGRPAAPRAW